ncbi:MAG: 1,4-dihydroxy-2-naphthoate octaprenyltransferase [Verrucomicrobiota bacterium]
MTTPSPILNWVRAARPKTLPAAVVPVAVGTALGATLSGEWFPGLAALTLLCCLAFQIATNFFNDAIDFKKGADTPQRLGPVRVTASGLISPRAVITSGVVLLLLAVILALPLVQARGWIIIAIGLPSMFLCYGYTGGPFPLAYLGLGELFVFLFFGLIAVAGSYFVQTNVISLHKTFRVC